MTIEEVFKELKVYGNEGFKSILLYSGVLQRVILDMNWL